MTPEIKATRAADNLKRARKEREDCALDAAELAMTSAAALPLRFMVSVRDDGDVVSIERNKVSPELMMAALRVLAIETLEACLDKFDVGPLAGEIITVAACLRFGDKPHNFVPHERAGLP
jgi:hypothetical protein